jgi:hypothetical protein
MPAAAIATQVTPVRFIGSPCLHVTDFTSDPGGATQKIGQIQWFP